MSAERDGGEELEALRNAETVVRSVREAVGGFHAELLKEPIRWENGYIVPPTKPGLGVELNEEMAAKHPYEG